MKLTQSDLIHSLQKQLNLPDQQAGEVVQAIFEALTLALANGEVVRLAGFGKFFVKQIGARTYRSPKADALVHCGPCNVVRFSAFARLDEKVAATGNDTLEQLTLGEIARERRESPRVDLPDVGSAIVRVSGIPVCEFKIKDVSDAGGALWVEADSVMLRNVRVGLEIDIRINHYPTAPGPVMQRARIVHITPSARPDRPGYYVLGVQVLGKLPI